MTFIQLATILFKYCPDPSPIQLKKQHKPQLLNHRKQTKNWKIQTASIIYLVLNHLHHKKLQPRQTKSQPNQVLPGLASSACSILIWLFHTKLCSIELDSAQLQLGNFSIFGVIYFNHLPIHCGWASFPPYDDLFFPSLLLLVEYKMNWLTLVFTINFEFVFPSS